MVQCLEILSNQIESFRPMTTIEKRREVSSRQSWCQRHDTADSTDECINIATSKLILLQFYNVVTTIAEYLTILCRVSDYWL
mmetsp:Transcript_7304/g.13862  ORF Transcript_7304/g.13862 Transcript_7304/m.13862 type:complete len:82 (-) Transcript_7304:364-609(-)